MTSRERVLCALGRGTPDRIPWVEHSVAPEIRAGIGHADDVEFAEFIGLDAVAFSGLQPMVANSLKDKYDFYDWTTRWPSPSDPSMFRGLEEFVGRARRTTLAVGYVGALGVGLLDQSFGVQRWNYLIADAPDFVASAVDRVCDWNYLFHEALMSYDLDYVHSGHDLVDNRGPMFPLDFLRKEVFPREKIVACQINVPWIYHCCGNLTTVMEDIIDQECSCVDPVQPECNDLLALKTKYGGRVSFKGNVSLDTLIHGTVEDVAFETEMQLRSFGPGGYIISSAHSLYSGCKLANVLSMAHTIRGQGEAA